MKITPRLKFYSGVLLGILIFLGIALAPVAFLPAQYIPWGIAGLEISFVFLYVAIDFQDRFRIKALILVSFSSALMLGLLVYRPSISLAFLAGGVPLVLLTIYRLVVPAARSSSS